MIKKIGRLAFLIVATVVFTTSAVFAQDNSIHRILSLYASGDSGTLLHVMPTERTAEDYRKSLFEDNELEFGVLYSRNFLNAQWLYLDLNLATVAESLMVIDEVGVGESGEIIEFQSVYKYNLPRVKGKIGLSGTLEPVTLNYLAFYASVDVVGLVQMLALEDHNEYVSDIEYGAPIEMGVGYTFDFGHKGNLTLGLDLEFSAAPYTYAYDSGTMSGQIDRGLSLLDINVAYNVPFATYFGFTTKAGFRFEGAGALDDAYGLEDDTATLNSTFGEELGSSSSGVYTHAGNHLAFSQNFGASFAIRWDNTFDVHVGGFNMYATLRSQFDNLVSDITITNPTDETDIYEFTQDFSFELKLILGVSYTFDF